MFEMAAETPPTEYVYELGVSVTQDWQTLGGLWKQQRKGHSCLVLPETDGPIEIRSDNGQLLAIAEVTTTSEAKSVALTYCEIGPKSCQHTTTSTVQANNGLGSRVLGTTNVKRRGFHLGFAPKVHFGEFEIEHSAELFAQQAVSSINVCQRYARLKP